MQITKTPYEFLVRFNNDGTIRGSHIKFYEAIDDGAGNMFLREGKAQPVESATESGFPIAQVLDAIHQGALATIGKLESDLAAANSKIAATSTI